MSSTNVNIGLSCDKSSSRVLKPPGGGHTDIFAPLEDKCVKPRAKNNQQNSASMSEIMGKPQGDIHNNHVQHAPEPSTPAEHVNGAEPAKIAESMNPAEPVKVSESVIPTKVAEKPVEPKGRTRVPPGGFSSGLW